MIRDTAIVTAGILALTAVALGAEHLFAARDTTPHAGLLVLGTPGPGVSAPPMGGTMLPVRFASPTPLKGCIATGAAYACASSVTHLGDEMHVDNCEVPYERGQTFGVGPPYTVIRFDCAVGVRFKTWMPSGKRATVNIASTKALHPGPMRDGTWVEYDLTKAR